MITNLNIVNTVSVLQLSESTLTSLVLQEDDEVNTLDGLRLIETPSDYYVLLPISSGGIPVVGETSWDIANW